MHSEMLSYNIESGLSSPEIEHQLQDVLQRVPPIIRLPSPKKRCPYTNLSRTSLCELIAPSPRNHFRPPVKANYLRRNERARRGVWLIPAEAIFRHLLSRGASDYTQMQEIRATGK